jgi:hypothetical protein
VCANRSKWKVESSKWKVEGGQPLDGLYSSFDPVFGFSTGMGDGKNPKCVIADHVTDVIGKDMEIDSPITAATKRIELGTLERPVNRLRAC